jgi:hypothetical protein
MIYTQIFSQVPPKSPYLYDSALHRTLDTEIKDTAIVS